MSNFFLAPEWAPQDWLWIGFPHLAEEWPRVLGVAQEQIAAFANAVAQSGEEVRLLVRDAQNAARARALVSAKVKLEQRAYGDIWLRDTGPLVRGDGWALRPRFNGWGGKFEMAGDETIGGALARDAGLEVIEADYVLEGGAIDSDGTGLAATTEQCLLNPNRNPKLGRAEIEAAFKRDLGLSRILWFEEGLVNDHTDGHVDNLARFVGPNKMVIPEARDNDDPNRAIYSRARARAEGFGVEVIAIPSPGRIERACASGEQIEPASYANFVVTNSLVVVPLFGSPRDQEAIAAVAELFPERDCIGLMADAVLQGGGGFHCASMQMPLIGAN